ncbi:uncharacterized protein BO96DRAFT_434466 [Aspergillus niger CBS 101883]|uniref:uncharacterized protein n=1 Tax=Aspergillus lacticoffeatus (strain CBS 101883) TaxID=1450533 RepID=UPI000D7F508D|nr:uncharacterized protein BO96DRAFT_434466 [Aspergillus niger CBS 101883]PYH56489.1 hypothetical protein BO96DRAFT_434466 [Aspergillus niger CBS 101883]
MCLVDAWMRQHIWAGLINKFTIASRQLFHLALAQLCVGFKHSGNANPSLFADSVCLCMYVLSSFDSILRWGYGGLRSSPDWHIRAHPFSSPPKPHQAINLIKAFCIELRRLLHTKAARNPVPGRLMSCCRL